jgi:phosphoglycolate phosphatase-like HAD superfamily hydrolase
VESIKEDGSVRVILGGTDAEKTVPNDRLESHLGALINSSSAANFGQKLNHVVPEWIKPGYPVHYYSDKRQLWFESVVARIGADGSVVVNIGLNIRQVSKDKLHTHLRAPPPTTPAGGDVAPGRGPSAASPVKIIFFDFDNTTTRNHVWKQLSGFDTLGSNNAPAPRAVTERGQIRKLEELNRMEENWAFNEETGGLETNGSHQVRWSAAALGGPTRVEELRAFYEVLQTKGVPIFIITKGFVGAVRKTLEAEGLLRYVDKVIGYTGNHYTATRPEFETSDLDKSSVPVPDFEGEPDSRLTGSKADFIQKELERRGLTAEQAILVEDDPAEVKSVEEATPKICRGKLIREGKGMTRPDMKELLEMVGSEASF